MDTHAHYEDRAFRDDADAIIKSFPANNIAAVVNVGSDVKTSRKSIQLAHTYPYVYAAVGIHPSETKGVTDADLEEIEGMLSEKKVVALGEIGLDYHYDGTDKVGQKEVFLGQLEIAKRKRCTIIIHSRDAAEDTLNILRQARADVGTIIMHCYSYSSELAREYTKLGMYFGIGGAVTFNNAKKLRSAVECIPMDRILLETDCPYMSPEPHRGERNTSLNLPHIISVIADIKGMTQRRVEEITYENARRAYRLP